MNVHVKAGARSESRWKLLFQQRNHLCAGGELYLLGQLRLGLCQLAKLLQT